MSDKQNIKNALKNILENPNEQFCIVCKVDSVDSAKLTAYCIPIEKGKADLASVRLTSDTNKKGFIQFPKVGSMVIVSFLNNDAGYIADCTEVDKIWLNADGYGGLVQIQPLVNKINALENMVNNLLTTLKTTVIPLAPSGTYPFAPLYTAYNNIAPITAKSDLENTTVLHGNGS